MKERKLEFKNRPSGYFGFRINWDGICSWMDTMYRSNTFVGYPLAATNPGSGVLYMIAYSLGFAIPFLILSFFVGRMKWITYKQRKDCENRRLPYDCHGDSALF